VKTSTRRARAHYRRALHELELPTMFAAEAFVARISTCGLNEINPTPGIIFMSRARQVDHQNGPMANALHDVKMGGGLGRAGAGHADQVDGPRRHHRGRGRWSRCRDGVPERRAARTQAAARGVELSSIRCSHVAVAADETTHRRQASSRIAPRQQAGPDRVGPARHNSAAAASRPNTAQSRIVAIVGQHADHRRCVSSPSHELITAGQGVSRLSRIRVIRVGER
jgi:hypothetical protein